MRPYYWKRVLERHHLVELYNPEPTDKPTPEMNRATPKKLYLGSVLSQRRKQQVQIAKGRPQQVPSTFSRRPPLEPHDIALLALRHHQAGEIRLRWNPPYCQHKSIIFAETVLLDSSFLQRCVNPVQAQLRLASFIKSSSSALLRTRRS